MRRYGEPDLYNVWHVLPAESPSQHCLKACQGVVLKDINAAPYHPTRSIMASPSTPWNVLLCYIGSLSDMSEHLSKERMKRRRRLDVSSCIIWYL